MKKKGFFFQALEKFFEEQNQKKEKTSKTKHQKDIRKSKQSSVDLDVKGLSPILNRRKSKEMGRPKKERLDEQA